MRGWIPLIVKVELKLARWKALPKDVYSNQFNLSSLPTYIMSFYEALNWGQL